MANITAKLAQVVSPAQLAFNAGSVQGVKLGDQVTLWRHVNIEDPVTKEPLGSVRIPRLLLKVTYIKEKFCIADVTTTDIDYPAATNALAFGRTVKVTTVAGQSRSGFATVTIGEDVEIRTPETSQEKSK